MAISMPAVAHADAVVQTLMISFLCITIMKSAFLSMPLVGPMVQLLGLLEQPKYYPAAHLGYSIVNALGALSYLSHQL
jgi:hypothetical protein